MKTAGKKNVTKKAVKTEAPQDIAAILNALNRVQAVIEFRMDGTILNANENFLAAVGYTLEEIKGQHHRMFCVPETSASLEYKNFWAKLNRGEFDAGEYKRVGKGGREIWINASYNPVFDKKGNPVKVVKFATDVTELKARTAEFEGKIQAISKAQAVIEFKLDGTIMDANENFLKTLGYDLAEIKGKHHRMFCEESTAQSHEYKMFWEKLNRGDFDAGEYKRLGKGGRVVWINASYNPIFTADGKPYKVVKYATDVTAMKNMFEAIEKSAVALSSSSMQLTTTAKELANTADRTNRESQSASSAADEVARGVQTVAVNMEEMVASIKEIGRSTSESSQMAKKTLQKAQESNATITKLGISSQEIGDVIKVISSIAQQTNLLALNATIEAARAGEAGKGFAVVANEVKELAKQTAKATEDITNKIGAIQNDTKSAVEAIAGISDAVEKLNGISAVIAAAVEEQTATTNEISRVVIESKRGVESISGTIKIVSSAASASMENSSQTLGSSEELSKLADTLSLLVNKDQKKWANVN